MNSISPNLNIMIKACEKVSKVIIRDFGEIENLQVAKKGPRDFVTKTDKRVEKILIEELNKAKKNYSFLTEESGKIENNDKDKIWIIDPIDGTINFLHGIPHFAISIALKSDDEIICGLIFDPIKDEMFYAEKNNGAFFNNQRIRVSKKNNLDEITSITSFNYDPIKDTGARFYDLNKDGIADIVQVKYIDGSDEDNDFVVNESTDLNPTTVASIDLKPIFGINNSIVQV